MIVPLDHVNPEICPPRLPRMNMVSLGTASGSSDPIASAARPLHDEFQDPFPEALRTEPRLPGKFEGSPEPPPPLGRRDDQALVEIDPDLLLADPQEIHGDAGPFPFKGDTGGEFCFGNPAGLRLLFTFHGKVPPSAGEEPFNGPPAGLCRDQGRNAGPQRLESPKGERFGVIY